MARSTLTRRPRLGIGQVTRASLSALLICGLIEACAQVKSQVEVFHELPTDYRGQAIGVLSGDKDKTGTLEFKSYAEKLSAKLTSVGFNGELSG